MLTSAFTQGCVQSMQLLYQQRASGLKLHRLREYIRNVLKLRLHNKKKWHVVVVLSARLTCWSQCVPLSTPVPRSLFVFVLQGPEPSGLYLDVTRFTWSDSAQQRLPVTFLLPTPLNKARSFHHTKMKRVGTHLWHITQKYDLTCAFLKKHTTSHFLLFLNFVIGIDLVFGINGELLNSSTHSSKTQNKSLVIKYTNRF